MDTNMILTISIPSIIAVLGWFVINWQNRRSRKEEAQRAIYTKLFDITNNVIEKLSTYDSLVHKNSNSIIQAIKSYQNTQDITEKNTHGDKWLHDVTEIIDSTESTAKSIGSYMRILDLGGTDFGRESVIFKALKSVYIDTERAFVKIAGKWINLTNFDSMTEIQFNAIKAEVDAEMKQLKEFSECLNDVLVHIYNAYIAKPMGYTMRDITNVDGRRSIVKTGLEDNRKSF